jgi:hypothetical protein
MSNMNILIQQLEEVNKALITASANEAFMLLERQHALREQIATLSGIRPEDVRTAA